ncbi:unnamed protein product, partial [Menidia menidia]
DHHSHQNHCDVYYCHPHPNHHQNVYHCHPHPNHYDNHYYCHHNNHNNDYYYHSHSNPYDDYYCHPHPNHYDKDHYCYPNPNHYGNNYYHYHPEYYHCNNNFYKHRDRPGSIIADFVVRTTTIDATQLTEANEKLKEAMTPIGKVIGSIVTEYRRKYECTLKGADFSFYQEHIVTRENIKSAPVVRVQDENVLDTVDVIIGDDSKESWDFLNANATKNASSVLLRSLEQLSDRLSNGTFNFTSTSQRIQLSRSEFNNSFSENLNSSVSIKIPDTGLKRVFITTIILSTLNNVMPTRTSTFDVNLLNSTSNQNDSGNAINAAVAIVRLSQTINNISLTYTTLNSNLKKDRQCVFWNFTLLDELGAWDDEGCKVVSHTPQKVTCNCNHLTSFSLLMSTEIPDTIKDLLDIITYVGVGISLASLVICLAIEGYVWKEITRNSTALLRHVSIVNTALCLLIADICFIIAAFVAKNPAENPGSNYEVPVGQCSAATFFMHFSYLAVFFWMLASGLLLFYRTVMVFSQMSTSTMLAIGFTLGYGCPLIIAVITVIVTAIEQNYIRKDYACWLNWEESKALLAMVIPALAIIFINIMIIIVVLFKMLRRGIGDSAQPDEKHTLVVIIRCVAILTPLFGLTWSLGIGTMISPTNTGIHIAFAFFNSLQGFFILVFGTLFDSKMPTMFHRLQHQIATVTLWSHITVMHETPKA